MLLSFQVEIATARMLETVLALVAVLSLGAVLAIWLGYPAVMALLARRGVALHGRALAPMVSVVLATRDEAAAVRARVGDALAADYPSDKLEIVVALDRSGSATRRDDLTDLDPRVRVVSGDEPGGKAAALNAGVRAARGEVLVMADTHTRFDPTAIGRLASVAMEPAIGAVSGRLVLPGAGDAGVLVRRYWDLEVGLREHEARVHSAIGVTGAIYAMRRELWLPLPPGVILDDVYLPMRLVLDGRRIAFERDAIAMDTRAPERTSEYRRKVRTLTGVLQLCAWLPATLLPGRNPVWAQFVVHKLLRLLTPYLLLLAVLAALSLAVLEFGAPRFLTVSSIVAVIIGILLLVRAELRHRVRELVMWGLTLQAAVVVATINGVRGRWDVWHR